MKIMTPEEILEHNKNPNVLVKLGKERKPFYCPCGCNVFHHKNDWDIYICNACKTEYESGN